MAQVTVSINGRQFRMACEDGQESHLMQLAQNYDQRIGDLRGKFGEIGNTRLAVMAALTIADELFEAGKRIRQLEQEVAGLQNAGGAAADRAKQTEAAIVAAFNAAAERIESLTRELNQSVGNGAVGMG
jgi:cell division protein ZapA